MLEAIEKNNRNDFNLAYTRFVNDVGRLGNPLADRYFGISNLLLTYFQISNQIRKELYKEWLSNRIGENLALGPTNLNRIERAIKNKLEHRKNEIEI